MVLATDTMLNGKLSQAYIALFHLSRHSKGFEPPTFRSWPYVQLKKINKQSTLHATQPFFCLPLFYFNIPHNTKTFSSKWKLQQWETTPPKGLNGILFYKNTTFAHPQVFAGSVVRCDRLQCHRCDRSPGLHPRPLWVHPAVPGQPAAEGGVQGAQEEGCESAGSSAPHRELPKHHHRTRRVQGESRQRSVENARQFGSYAFISIMICFL